MNFKPVRQFGQRYSFVRRKAPGPIYEWDADSLIQNALAVSRLVRGNGHDAHYSVRVIDGVGTPDKGPQIVPAVRWDAWHADDGQRDWLSQPEAEELADLLPRFLAIDRWSVRVNNAFWLIEYAARTGFAVPAVIWTVSATEALLNTDPVAQRRQFVERCRGLAADVQVAGVTDDLTDRFYTARSESVHGATLSDGDQPQMLADLAVMQLLVRTALRRCIEDPSFRANFNRDDAVQAKWPLGSNTNGALPRPFGDDRPGCEPALALASRLIDHLALAGALPHEGWTLREEPRRKTPNP
jgi:hypothetical protein